MAWIDFFTSFRPLQEVSSPASTLATSCHLAKVSLSSGECVAGGLAGHTSIDLTCEETVSPDGLRQFVSYAATQERSAWCQHPVFQGGGPDDTRCEGWGTLPWSTMQHQA